MKTKKGRISVVVAIAIIFICVVVGGIVYGGSRLFRTSPTIYLTPTPPQTIGDIDRSGVVDESDIQLVRTHIGCKKEDTCWRQVIGKTRDGDNPLYVFDVDLNKDSVINQDDLDLVK